jgi:hypothetical protein
VIETELGPFPIKISIQPKTKDIEIEKIMDRDFHIEV